MTEWFEIARWLAGAVLIVSGILKIGRTKQLHYSLGELGFSAPFVQNRWVGSLLMPLFPFAEIAIGLGVLCIPTRVFPLFAVVFFAVFLWVVARSVSKGREATCDCFGGYGNSSVTGSTIIRNAVLLLVAVLGAFSADAPVLSWADRWGTVVAIIAFAIPILLAVGLALWRPRVQLRRARRLASSLVLRDIEGREIQLSEFAEPATYLVFFSPSCGGCRKVVERFRWWPNAAPEGTDVQPVFIGRPESFAGIPEFEPLHPYAWYDADSSVAHAVGMAGTPGAVLIDAEHPLGDGWAAGGRAAEKYVVRPGFYDALRAELGEGAAEDQAELTDSTEI